MILSFSDMASERSQHTKSLPPLHVAVGSKVGTNAVLVQTNIWLKQAGAAGFITIRNTFHSTHTSFDTLLITATVNFSQNRVKNIQNNLFCVLGLSSVPENQTLQQILSRTQFQCSSERL